MDWIYKGVSGVVDREEYLKGRKIDKTFELLEQEENPKEANQNNDEFRLPSTSNSNAVSESDSNAKMLEDPLFEIQMKQMEQRKEILKNPLKLKKLKDMLWTSIQQDCDSKKKKKKKSKKKKHDKVTKKKSKKSSQHSSSDSDSSTSHKGRHHHRKKQRKVDDSPLTKHHENKSPIKSKSWSSFGKEDKFDENDRYQSDKKSVLSQPKKRKAMSEEEMERRRQEMQMNAEWRDKTRHDHVEKLNARERLEEQKSLESRGQSAQFIKPMLSDHLTHGQNSIEDSVRRKRFKLQRGANTMDTNFAKKFA